MATTMTVTEFQEAVAAAEKDLARALRRKKRSGIVIASVNMDTIKDGLRLAVRAQQREEWSQRYADAVASGNTEAVAECAAQIKNIFGVVMGKAS